MNKEGLRLALVLTVIVSFFVVFSLNMMFTGSAIEGNSFFAAGTLVKNFFLGEPEPDIEPTCIPTIEICDGTDNDCDSFIDEGGVCGEQDVLVGGIKPTMQFDDKSEYKIFGYIIEFKGIPTLEKKKKLEEQQSNTKLTTNEESTTLYDYKKQLEETHFLAKVDFENILKKPITSENLLGEYTKTFNGIALDISAEEARKLKQSDYVKTIYPNYFVFANLMDSVPLINADDVWLLQDSQERQITGEGVTIAILDTGVDYTHPDLGGCFIPDITTTCFPKKEVTVGGCTDSDGGINYCVNGRASLSYGVAFDVCNNNLDLREWYCDADGNRKSSITTCPFGCVNGECKQPENNINYGNCSKVVDGYDFVTCETFNIVDGTCIYPKEEDIDPMDYTSHGTHVAATAAGNGILKGVAPDAKIYAYKVLNWQGIGLYSWIINGIERAVDPNQDSDFSDHVDIISMSLSGAANVPGNNPILSSVNLAVDVGIIVVIAAGNSGNYKKIGNPGISEKAITVGATDKKDVIASFSSRGPVNFKGFYLKPDIVAPGVNICSALGTGGGRNCIDNNHRLMSGTSMATPHVAGVAALLKQKYPDMAPDRIKSILSLSTVPTKLRMYRGKRNIWDPGFSEYNTQEFCTKINSIPNIDVATATYKDYFTIEDRDIDNAVLRADLENNPGVIIQQTPWEIVDEMVYEAKFVNLVQGTYWLCITFKNPISIFSEYNIRGSPTDERIFDEDSATFIMPDTGSLFTILYLDYQIPSSVYDEGSGRIDILKAINTPIVTSNSILSFGLVTENSAHTKKFVINNLKDQSINIKVIPSLSRRAIQINREIIESVEEYDYVSATIEIRTLPPQGAVEVQANLKIPNNALEGYYSGKIRIYVDGEDYIVPYSFIIIYDNYYRVPYSNIIPVIDGVINSEEWLGSTHYSNLGTNRGMDLYLKTGKINDENILFIGISIRRPVSHSNNIILWFDEGDDGEFGSGSFDRILKYSQEDQKQVSFGGTKMDGYALLSSWFLVSNSMDPISIEFSSYTTSDDTTSWSEIAIPFLDEGNGNKMDRSDIDINYGDVLGFAVSYLNGSGYEYFPVGFQGNDAFTFKAKLQIEQIPICGDLNFDSNAFQQEDLEELIVIMNAPELPSHWRNGDMDGDDQLTETDEIIMYNYVNLVESVEPICKPNMYCETTPNGNCVGFNYCTAGELVNNQCDICGCSSGDVCPTEKGTEKICQVSIQVDKSGGVF